MSNEALGIAIVIAIVCAIACSAMAKSKGLNPGGYMLAGLFLGVIGLLITAVAHPAPPPERRLAPGWYPDPWRLAQLRWYDGWQWTPHVYGAAATWTGFDGQH